MKLSIKCLILLSLISLTTLLNATVIDNGDGTFTMNREDLKALVKMSAEGEIRREDRPRRINYYIGVTALTLSDKSFGAGVNAGVIF